jgi:hypothetical protein
MALKRKGVIMRSSTKSRQDEYVSRLNMLYSDVVKWIKDTDLKVSHDQVELHEEVIGSYKAPALVIQEAQGNKVVDLLPVGARIIGAEGRVDLVGRLDRNNLVYLKTGGPQITTRVRTGADGSEESARPLFKGVERPGWYWIGETRLGRAHPLTKELFLDLLSEVSDYDV